MLNKFTALQEFENDRLGKRNDDGFSSLAAFVGKANGTFGELLQGVLPNNEHFLVTFPIKCFTRCVFIANESSTELTVYPPQKKKSLLLAKNILDHAQLKLGGQLIIQSELAEGKGLASSSADLVATAKALEKGLNRRISTDSLLAFLREIEPTDGVMYPGVVSFYHKQVKLREYLGSLSRIIILGIDEGGIVDTIEYNKKNRYFTEDEKVEYEYLLTKISLAVKNSDMKLIGEIATRSALMNQNHNPKKYLSQIQAICATIQGLGVIVGHSGTCIGIMLDTWDSAFKSKVEQARSMLSQITSKIDLYEAYNTPSSENDSISPIKKSKVNI